jgi:hypothetical protein
MIYDRNEIVKQINTQQKEKNLYVFNIFTGKIIRKELFFFNTGKFNNLVNRGSCSLAWFMLNNLWSLNSKCYPIFYNNEYLGMQTLTKGFVYARDIGTIFKKR